MASDIKRAKLLAEIGELQSFQLESNREAVFGVGLVRLRKRIKRRADRLERLVKELEALDGLSW
jgi:hypothetical protein